MTENLGTAVVGIGMDLSGMNAGLNAVKSLFSGGITGIIAGSLLAIGGAAIAVGVKSTQMAGDFQQSMNKVSALAAPATENMKQMGDAILAMAGQVGQTPVLLANGLYDIESAGFHGANALNILKLSAESATIGMTDTHTVSDALTSALNAFQVPASKANSIMDAMNATVSGGKMQWAQYAHVVGVMSVTAHTAGISFDAANAALATMTDSGMTAQRASMNLNNLMRQLGINTDKVAAAAKGFGLSFDEAKFKTMDLGAKLAYLQEITHGNTAEMYKLTGGAAGMTAASILLSNHMSQFNSVLSGVKNSAGETQTAWEKTTAGLNVSLQRLKAGFDGVMISLGEKLLPIVTSVINAVTPAIVAFGNWISNTDGLSKALAPLGYFLQYVGYIGGQALKDIGDTLTQVGQIFKSVFSILGGDSGDNPVTMFFSNILTVAYPIIGQLGQSFHAFMMDLQKNLSTVNPQALISAFHSLMSGIQPVLSIIGGQLKTNLQFFGQEVKQVAGWFTSAMVPAIQQAMPGFEKLASVVFTQLIPALAKMWVVGETIGRAIIPVIIGAFETFEPIVIKIAGLLDGWLAQALQFLIPYIVQAAQEVGKFAQDISTRAMPIIAMFGKNIGIVVDFISHHWHQVWDELAPYVMGVFNVIKGGIQIAWALISGIFKIALDVISGNWGRAWNDMKDMLHGVWDGIVSIFRGGIDMVIGLVNGMISGLDGMGIDIGPVHIHPNIPRIPMLASGGSVGPGMPFIAGERGPELITAGSSGASVTPLSGGGGNVHIYFDSMEFMHVVASRQDQYVKARLGPRSRNN